jgi:hypothetical protein
MVRHLVELLGSVKLVELKVRSVHFALGKLAKRLSTRRVRLARMILDQDREIAARVPDPRDRGRGPAGPGPEAGGVPREGWGGMEGERPGVLHEARCPMYATDVRMEFKRITEKAGLGRDWTLMNSGNGGD